MVEIKHTHISRITDDGYCESLSKSQFVKKDDGFRRNHSDKDQKFGTFCFCNYLTVA